MRPQSVLHAGQARARRATAPRRNFPAPFGSRARSSSKTGYPDSRPTVRALRSRYSGLSEPVVSITRLSKGFPGRETTKSCRAPVSFQEIKGLSHSSSTLRRCLLMKSQNGFAKPFCRHPVIHPVP